MIYNVYDEPDKNEIDKFLNETFPKFDDIKSFNLSSTKVMSCANSFGWKVIKRIYEDDNFIIDLIDTGSPTIRVGIFKDNHFQDEVIIRKDDYCG